MCALKLSFLLWFLLFLFKFKFNRSVFLHTFLMALTFGGGFSIVLSVVNLVFDGKPFIFISGLLGFELLCSDISSSCDATTITFSFVGALVVILYGIHGFVLDKK